jgi:hypothetical protein
MGFFPQLISLKHFALSCQKLTMSLKIVPETFSELRHKKKQSAIPAMLGVLDIFISPDSSTAPMNDKAHTLDTDSAEKHSR